MVGVYVYSLSLSLSLFLSRSFSLFLFPFFCLLLVVFDSVVTRDVSFMKLNETRQPLPTPLALSSELPCGVQLVYTREYKIQRVEWQRESDPRALSKALYG